MSSFQGLRPCIYSLIRSTTRTVFRRSRTRKLPPPWPSGPCGFRCAYIATTASRCRGGQCAILNMSRDSGVHKSKKTLSISLYVQYRVLSSSEVFTFSFPRGHLPPDCVQACSRRKQKRRKTNKIYYVQYCTRNKKYIFCVHLSAFLCKCKGGCC